MLLCGCKQQFQDLRPQSKQWSYISTAVSVIGGGTNFLAIIIHNTHSSFPLPQLLSFKSDIVEDLSTLVPSIHYQYRNEHSTSLIASIPLVKYVTMCRPHSTST